jgi:hypothetical protein
MGGIQSLLSLSCCAVVELFMRSRQHIRTVRPNTAAWTSLKPLGELCATPIAVEPLHVGN